MEIASFDVKRRFTETGGRLRWAMGSSWVRIPPLALSQPAVRADGPRSRVSGHDELDPACRGAALLACLATRGGRLLLARGLAVRGKLAVDGPLGKNRRRLDGPSTEHGHCGSCGLRRTHGHTRWSVAGPAPGNRAGSLAGDTPRRPTREGTAPEDDAGGRPIIPAGSLLHHDLSQAGTHQRQTATRADLFPQGSPGPLRHLHEGHPAGGRTRADLRRGAIRQPSGRPPGGNGSLPGPASQSSPRSPHDSGREPPPDEPGRSGEPDPQAAWLPPDGSGRARRSHDPRSHHDPRWQAMATVHPHPSPVPARAAARPIGDSVRPASRLPLRFTGFDWPADGNAEKPLGERYCYDDLDLDAVLSAKDFDPANPEYEF